MYSRKFCHELLTRKSAETDFLQKYIAFDKIEGVW